MLSRQSYFIREHVGMLKLTDTYDILDPDSQEQIGIAKEEPGGMIIAMRFLINKKTLPTRINVYEGSETDGKTPKFSIKRGFTFLRSRVDILDSEGNCVGYLKSKLLSLGGAFVVFDASDNEVAAVKGDWKGWNFRFLAGETEIGTVSKEWAGVGKALFTSADNYMINLAGETSPQKVVLLLAAGLAIDTVFNE